MIHLELLLLLLVIGIVVGCIVYIFNGPKKEIVKDPQPLIEPEPSRVQYRDWETDRKSVV